MRSFHALALLGVLLALTAPSVVLGGAYVPFDPKLWALPASGNFKIQKYYSGETLGLASEYGNLPKARSLAVSGLSKLNGPVITYVSTKGAASQAVYAMVDRFGRGQADYAFKIINFSHLLPNASAGNPNAIAWLGGETGSANGTLYILVSNYWVNNQLYKVLNIDSYALSQTAVPTSALVLVREDFPNDSWHGWRYIRFDSAKNLYVAIGANCNACDVYGPDVDNGWYYSRAYDANLTAIHNTYQKNATTAKFQFASIYKIAPPYTATTAPGFTQHAAGVRNTVGFDVHPTNGYLYFTDNGRDDIGGANTSDPNVIAKTRNTPDCEFNVATSTGQNYGFPFCHTGPVGNASVHADPAEVYPHLRYPGVGADHVDPDLNAGQTKKTCDGSTYKKAIQAMGPHVAALGMRFFKKHATSPTLTNFPLSFDGAAFIAQRGSWDRDTAIGARVMTVKLNTAGTGVTAYNYFLAGGVPCDYGSKDGPSCDTPGSSQRALQTWVGRPVDIEQLPDTTILVSDDEMGAVYRIVYCDPAKPSFGSSAPYGVGRCGRMPHQVTTSKLSPPVLASNPSISSGCRVNLGPAGIKAYFRCIEYDASGLAGRGAHTVLAYNVKNNNGQIVMDGAYVLKDAVEVNGNGWMAWGFGGGLTMSGQNVFVTTPTTGGSGGATATYKLGPGSAGVAGFTAATNFLVPGSAITAAMAGDALVTSFQAIMPSKITTRGGSLAAMAALGDVSSTGALSQHWSIQTLTVSIGRTEVGATASTTTPIINPASASEPSYTPACPSSALTPGTCAQNAGAGCLNGETFNAMTTLTSYPGMTMSIYSTLVGSVLTVGISANVASFNGANGYTVMCIPKGSTMSGNDCLFLRKVGTGTPEAVNYILDGYGGYQPSLPATCTYTNNQALATGTVSNLVGRFTMPFNTTAIKIRFGGNAAPGGTGIDGMVKHPAGSPPFFACMSNNGQGGVNITPMPWPTVNALDSAGWAGSACA